MRSTLFCLATAHLFRLKELKTLQQVFLKHRDVVRYCIKQSSV